VKALKRRIPGLGLGLLLACGSGDPFIDDLRHPSPDRRTAAAEFLGAQREIEAVRSLRLALGDSVPGVRAKVVWALGMIRAREARTDIQGLLGDPDRGVRQAVAWSLMQFGEPEAVPVLEAAIRTEKDPWVRSEFQRTVHFLRQFEGEEGVREGSFR
jgi:HEAT repeat protein